MKSKAVFAIQILSRAFGLTWSSAVRVISSRRLVWAAIALPLAAPAYAQPPLEKGFAGALHGCEEWVLNPDSWANGPAPFLSTVGLGDQMVLVSQVDEAALPPKPMRIANHFWRINSTPGAGYILVVSDRLPMCHITGGGDADLQPIIATVLASSDFQRRWKLMKVESKGDLTTSQFQCLEEPAFSLVISRAAKAGQRLDRVQVLVTATFRTGK